jgi:hypothetical protein
MMYSLDIVDDPAPKNLERKQRNKWEEYGDTMDDRIELEVGRLIIREWKAVLFNDDFREIDCHLTKLDCPPSEMAPRMGRPSAQTRVPEYVMLGPVPRSRRSLGF